MFFCFNNIIIIAQLTANNCAYYSTSDAIDKVFGIGYNKFGHVYINGEFQERPDVDTSLVFEFRSDQTQVQEMLSSLRKVISIFGDNKGVR